MINETHLLHFTIVDQNLCSVNQKMINKTHLLHFTTVNLNLCLVNQKMINNTYKPLFYIS